MRKYIYRLKKWQKDGEYLGEVQLLCGQKRIDGVFRIGNIRVIPQDAEKPEDARIMTEKYRKNVEYNAAESD